MAQPVNPYVAGAPMQGAGGFFGRQDTLDWVARGLRNPVTNSLVLFGQRRIGKTTLLLQLRHTLSADAFLPVYFDLQDQAARPLGQVLADLADIVAEQVGLAPPDPQVFDDRGLFFIRTFLPQAFSVLGKNRRLVFLLDEFDVLDEATEEELPATAAGQSLVRFMRRVMTKDHRPAFVFAVGRRIDDLALDFTATFKASLVREVWVLDRKSAAAMVRQAEAPGQSGALRFTNQAVARILSLTNGHPYLTQLLCQQIWERAYAGHPTTPPRIGAPEVKAAVPSTLEAGDQAMVWIWDGLSVAEKIYAANLAGAAGEGETITEEQGMQILANHAARLRTREVELTAPRDLVRRRVLDMTGEQEHRFAIELFRRWIHQHRPLRDVKHELDRVDPLAEELCGIGQEFFRREQFKTAARYFRDVLAANPHHFYARLRLGETLLQLAQTDKAVTELEWAYKQDREEARLLLTRALVAQARAREKVGNEKGALAACERALQVSPRERTAQKIRSAILVRQLEAEARGHEQAGRWAEATATYTQLVVQAPEEENQKWKAAFERCRKEEFLTRRFSEGLEALEKKDWEQAQGAFAQVVHSRPDYGVDKQLAARLLLQAVLQKPVRKYTRLLTATFAIVVLAVVVSLLYSQSWKEKEILPPVELPENWEHVCTYRLDANRDSNQEWVVLYRFDLPSETGHDGSPIGGVVYQPGDSSPFALTPYELRPQGGNYLCECECTAAMEDVLSGSQGPELVVRDRCNGEITKLSIFYWEPGKEEYVPRGYFSGSRVEIELNSVTVDQRLPHRAQLALRQTYRPSDGETYYEPLEQGILVMPEKYELVFYQAEPKDVKRSPYPEKVVLAFYNHYTDDQQAAEYFTEKGWEQLEQCAAGRCGCASARSEIAHVRVTNLQPEEYTYGKNSPGSDRAVFDFNVLCEHRDGTLEDETFVRWYLVRQDDRWRLDDAEVIYTEEQERDGQ